jgi:hypothetical protein
LSLPRRYRAGTGHLQIICLDLESIFPSTFPALLATIVIKYPGCCADKDNARSIGVVGRFRNADVENNAKFFFDPTSYT